MFKKILTITIVSIFLGLILVVYLYWGNHLVILKDGRTIEAEKVWGVGNEVFFINNEKVDFVHVLEVEKIIPIFTQSPADLSYIFYRGQRKGFLRILHGARIGLRIFWMACVRCSRGRAP